MTEKDKKIIEECEKTGEPIFVLRAKDKYALETLIEYRELCAHKCSTDHFQAIEKRIDEFGDWGIDNESKMKIPD